MVMRAKPTALRVLEGMRGHRPLNDAEPKFDPDSEPPSHILKNKIALEHWNYYAPRLLKVGVLTEADRDALASMCLQHAIKIKALKEINRNLETAIAKGMHKAYQTADTAYRQWNSKLGLNPSDRSQIKAAKPNRDPLEDYKKKKKLRA